MGLFARLRKADGRHLVVKVQPPIVRRGEEVVASVSLADPDAVSGELFAGLRCRRNERRKGYVPATHQVIDDPLFETYDRKQVLAEWRPLDGRGPWQLRFVVPADAPASKGDHRKHAWRVEVRERRTGAKDAIAHASFIVR